MLDNDGVMHIIAAARTFKEEATCRLSEETGATPAFINGRIYIRGLKHVYCVGGEVMVGMGWDYCYSVSFGISVPHSLHSNPETPLPTPVSALKCRNIKVPKYVIPSVVEESAFPLPFRAFPLSRFRDYSFPSQEELR